MGAFKHKWQTKRQKMALSLEVRGSMAVTLVLYSGRSLCQFTSNNGVNSIWNCVLGSAQAPLFPCSNGTDGRPNSEKNWESSTIDSKEKEEEEQSIFFVLKNAPRLQRSNEWISFGKKALRRGEATLPRTLGNKCNNYCQSKLCQSVRPRALKLPSK